MIVSYIGWMVCIIYRKRFYVGLGIYYNYWIFFYICILLLYLIIRKCWLKLVNFFWLKENLKVDGNIGKYELFLLFCILLGLFSCLGYILFYSIFRGIL